LETYARQTGNKIVKPFMLVIARDTTHAKALLDLIEADQFFDGRYRAKVLQVDSTTKEEEVIQRLLAVESADTPHVLGEPIPRGADLPGRQVPVKRDGPFH